MFLVPRLVDGADHVERALRPLVASPVKNCMAALESLNQRYGPAGLAGKGLRDREGLREEALQPASPHDNEPIADAEFLNSKKGDDVLQFLVVRNRLPYLLRNAVMLLADDGRIKQNRR